VLLVQIDLLYADDLKPWKAHGVVMANLANGVRDGTRGQDTKAADMEVSDYVERLSA